MGNDGYQMSASISQAEFTIREPMVVTIRCRSLYGETWIANDLSATSYRLLPQPSWLERRLKDLTFFITLMHEMKGMAQ